MVSLMEFAKPRTVPCVVCNSGNRSEIEKGRASGISYSRIAQWMTDVLGLPNVTASRVRGHFDSGHGR